VTLAGSYLDCGVDPGGRAGPGVKDTSMLPTANYWAEMDVQAAASDMAMSFYFEGGGNYHRHSHIDVLKAWHRLRYWDGSTHEEADPVAIPLASGLTLAVAVEEPRYVVAVNGTRVTDFTATTSTPAGGLGFDCVSQSNGAGSVHITGLRIYSLATP
jgi:hypothetical protein